MSGLGRERGLGAGPPNGVSDLIMAVFGVSNCYPSAGRSDMSSLAMTEIYV